MSSKFNVCIIGDAMVDEYYSVKIKGVSPEFPIPSMHSCESSPSTIRPGGAANTAQQFLYFKNVFPWLLSFLDEYSKKCFSPASFNIDLCTLPEGCQVPVKRRFYSDGFPTYRWDVEKEDYNLGIRKSFFCECLYSNLLSRVSFFDAIIFSDYCKGVLSEFGTLPKCVLTVVDSKSDNIDRWFGCSVFKPNLKEARDLSGKRDPLEAGRWIRSRIRCDHVVITNADKGVTVVSKEGEYNIPSHPHSDACSVIGAGDCFTSILTVSLLEGMGIFESARRALRAGSLYVKKRYNSPVSPLDVLEGKLVDDPSLLSNRDFKLVFTNGCFDLIHSGHIENLKFAKSKGDKLVVALNDDESIGRIKTNRPIQPLKDRINIISSLSFVDYVVYFSEDTPLRVINEIKPDVLLKGDEYSFDQIVGSDIIKEVFTFPMVSGLSTTNLIGKVKSI